MANKTIGISDELAAYVLEVGTREPEVLVRLREETSAIPMHRMQIPPEQGAFLALLVEPIGARRCIEVGTFTGYSSAVIALALPEDGQLVCCDVSEEWTSMARKYWDEAGVAGKIDLRIAPAADTLDHCWPTARRMLRPRVHRRRQGWLRRLLRAVAATGPARRADRHRQHVVGRRGDQLRN